MIHSLASGLFSAASAPGPLAVGASMPDVAQRNQDGRMVSLSPVDTGLVLVYFYPKSGTPACTKQACGLRDSFESLSGGGIRILGVSRDSVRAQKAFKEKHGLPFDLLADEDGTVVRAFGVPTTMGFTKRQSFLFKDGTLVWRDLTASAGRQSADVLDFLATTS